MPYGAKEVPAVTQPRTFVLPLSLLTLGHFASDFYSNFLPALLPVFVANLGLSFAAGGMLVMVSSFTASILQPLCGYYIDKRGYSWLILVTLPASALTICFSTLAPSYAALVACVALAGLGSSIFHPLATSMVNKVTPPGERGLAMALFIGVGNLGFGLAPVIVIYWLLAFGPDTLPWLFIPAALLTAAYYYGRLHRVSLTPPALPAGGGAVWYKSFNLLKLNVVMALRSWTQMALPNFLAVWLVQQGHPTSLAGGLLTVYLVGGAVGAFVGGGLADRFGRKTCIMSCLAICLPAMYIFLRSPEIGPLAWTMLAIAGAAMQGTMPSSIVWAQEMIPGNAAMASGMMLGLSFGLGGVGVAITGALADRIGLAPALLWSLLPLAAALPLTYAIPTVKKPAPGHSAAG
jgi:FSR family fosmidomycin resistance protein-like MFS transporter